MSLWAYLWLSLLAISAVAFLGLLIGVGGGAVAPATKPLGLVTVPPDRKLFSSLMLWPRNQMVTPCVSIGFYQLSAAVSND